MSRTIVLTDNNKDTLENYLNSLNSTTECELRFGKFIYVENDDKKRVSEFVANVEIDFFYRLKSILDKQEGLTKNSVFTKEMSYENTNGSGKIRETIYTDINFKPTGNKEYMLKNTYKKPHNLFDYDCRISLSSEKKLLKDNIKGVNFNNPTFIRYKNRVSYKFDCGSLDMTIVHQGLTEEIAIKDTRYEIEFEISKNNYKSVLEIISFILQIKQDNYYVMNNSEKRNLIYQYKTLVMNKKGGYPYFVGAQPETLQKDQLSMLFKELYSVTDKADGDRYFMFIDEIGNVSFIDSNINNILKTNVTSEYKNTIIDGELIRDDTKTLFYAFDILFYNGKDLRGDKNFLLRQRLSTLNDVMKGTTSTDLYTIKMKTFIFRNVFMGSDIIMKNIDSKPYKNDGLIFTPMNEPYPINKKWSKLLKWKPAELNTIDFFSVKRINEGKEIWELYVQHVIPQDDIKRTAHKTDLVLFDVEKLCNSQSDTKQITFQTTFSDKLLDTTTNEPYKTNTVIEYRWDSIEGKFLPLRTRWDKTANKMKHGNFSAVACSIWHNINNPITQLQLRQMTNNSTEPVNSENSFFFERMIKFHNKINEYLMNKYILPKEYVVELNTINQIKGGFETITFSDCIKKSNFNYKNFKLDLTNETACKTIKEKLEKKANSIFCLKFNLFFKSHDILDNFIHIIDYNLENNGKLIISFISESKKDEIDESCIIDNEIMYNVEKNKEESMKIFINGINNEQEYMIDYNYLIEYFKNKGYDCIETELYRDLYKMYPKTLLPYEEDVSNMYRYCVFQKSKIISPFIIRKVDILPKIISTNCMIEHKNLQYYKIKTTHDIYDILNCIKYTIFKNNYNNTEIKCYDDIIECLSQTDYNCIYRNLINKNDNTKKANNLYFHGYTFTELLDNETLTQYYIILHKNSIVHNNNTIEEINNILTNKVKEEENVEKEIIEKEIIEKEEIVKKEIIKEENNINVESILDDISNKKVTVLKIKEYLKLFNCKTTGNKDEMLNRLKERLLVKN